MKSEEGKSKGFGFASVAREGLGLAGWHAEYAVSEGGPTGSRPFRENSYGSSEGRGQGQGESARGGVPTRRRPRAHAAFGGGLPRGRQGGGGEVNQQRPG